MVPEGSCLPSVVGALLIVAEDGTLRTMTLLMSSSVGCESMLKWVGVSVEGETRVGVKNHSFV